MIGDHVLSMYIYFWECVFLLIQSLIDYFSDEKNKKDVMSNFVRLTVYIKDLTVETIEDVAGYSKIDLISDIGQSIKRSFFYD